MRFLQTTRVFGATLGEWVFRLWPAITIVVVGVSTTLIVSWLWSVSSIAGLLLVLLLLTIATGIVIFALALTFFE